MTVNVSKPAINVRSKLAELDKHTGIAGEAMLRAETPQEQFNLIGAGRRNLIINGAMQVAQRGTSATGKSTTGYYSVDRFSNQFSNAGTFTVSQAAEAPDGFGYSYKVTTTAADSSPVTNLIRYMIEGTDMQHLAYGTSSAQPMIASFWVRSNKTGAYSFNIEQKKTASTYDLFSHSYTIEAEGVWEKKVVHIPANTSNVIYNDNTNSINLHWWLGSASNYQNDSRTEDKWYNYVGGDLTRSSQVNIGEQTNNYFQITGVQLELGKVATPFEHRSYGEELALCQRYYYSPLRGGDSNSNNGFMAQSYGANSAYIPIQFPVEMRTRPTFGMGGLWATRLGNNNSFTASGSTQIYSKAGGVFYTSVSSLPSATSCWIEPFSGDTSHTAYMNFDAEL